MIGRLYDLNGKAYNLSGNDVATRKRRQNGEKEMQLTLHKNHLNESYFDDIDYLWKLDYKGEPYKIVLIDDDTDGDSYTRRFSLLHEFYDDLRNDFIYDSFTGSRTFNDILQFILGDSGYPFTVTGNFFAQQFENFGDDFVLELFGKALERYGAEFRISSGMIYISPKQGEETDFQFRYKFNLHSVARQIDALDFSTYGEGFGKDGLHVTYTSPLAEIFRTSKNKLRHMKAIRDERFTIRDSLYNRVKKEVDESLRISITIKFEDMRAAGYPRIIPNEGDEVLLYEPRLGLKVKTRIVEIVEIDDSNGNVIDCDVTLSNFTNLDEQQKRFEKATKAISDALDGKRPLPFTALDKELQRLANQIFDSESQVEYGEGGIVARDKNNPNHMLILNSGGLAISRDNGQTVALAITADGIATELLTAGTINANRIRIFGGDGPNNEYILLEQDKVEQVGTHTRTWFGETSTETTRTRLQRGYLITESLDLDQRLYVSNKGISTTMIGSAAEDGEGESGGDETEFWGSGVLEFYSTRYEDVRGITMSSNRGTVALKSYFRDTILDAARDSKIWAGRGAVIMEPHRDVRSGTNQFMWRVKDNESSSDTDGWQSFGSSNPDIPHATGLRFKKSTVGDPTLWVTDGEGNKGTGALVAKWLKADYFEGDIRTNTTNLYAMTNDVFRVTDMRGFNNGNPSYKHIAGDNVFIGQLRPLENNHDLYLTAGSGREVKVTNLQGANNGDIGYRAIRASEFLDGSSMMLKQNVQPVNYSVMPLLRKIGIVSYYYNEDVSSGIYNNRQVGMIAELTPELASADGKAINLYKHASYNTKGIQENDSRITALERADFQEQIKVLTDALDKERADRLEDKKAQAKENQKIVDIQLRLNPVFRLLGLPQGGF